MRYRFQRVAVQFYVTQWMAGTAYRSEPIGIADEIIRKIALDERLETVETFNARYTVARQVERAQIHKLLETFDAHNLIGREIEVAQIVGGVKILDASDLIGV